MLMGVIAHGTGAAAKIGRPAAGKTGTTSDYRDAWFVGYVPDLVVGVWIGNDDNAAMNGMTGGRTPAVIWKAFMQKALGSAQAKNFDGSAAVKGDTVDEVEDDKKTDKNKKADDKKAEQDSKKQAADKQSGDKQQSQPAVPAPTAPEPGGGVSKGKN